MLGNLLGGFIIILVGVNLLPAISDGTYAATNDLNNASLGTNVTGASETITELIPLFYALGLMSAGVAVTVTGLKNAGVM